MKQQPINPIEATFQAKLQIKKTVPSKVINTKCAHKSHKTLKYARGGETLKPQGQQSPNYLLLMFYLKTVKVLFVSLHESYPSLYVRVLNWNNTYHYPLPKDKFVRQKWELRESMKLISMSIQTFLLLCKIQVVARKFSCVYFLYKYTVIDGCPLEN